MDQLSLLDIISRGLNNYKEFAGAKAFKIHTKSSGEDGAGKTKNKSERRSENASRNSSNGPRAEQKPAIVNTSQLRKAAESIQKRIDFCRQPRLENTRKRRQEAANFEKEAQGLELIKTKLIVVADGHENGTLPEILRCVTTRLQVETLQRRASMPKAESYFMDEYKAMIRAGINENNFEEASRALIELGKVELSEEEKAARRIRELEREAAGSLIPGFFATPVEVVLKMIDLADIRNGHCVLEPSAGTGRIADQLAKLEIELETIEINYTLAEILKLKGHSVRYTDFLTVDHEQRFERVLMNPPFERGQDMAHIRHAFDMLKPNGRLVAIMSEGTFFRSDRKTTEFREWLERHSFYSDRLEHGTFRESGTDVASRILVIDKPA